MAEPQDSLERVVLQLEAVGEIAAADKVKGFLAELAAPPKAAPKPSAKAATAKSKEG